MAFGATAPHFSEKLFEISAGRDPFRMPLALTLQRKNQKALGERNARTNKMIVVQQNTALQEYHVDERWAGLQKCEAISGGIIGEGSYFFMCKKLGMADTSF